ncbi:YccF domain-containing protein [Halospeciosus flavus]|uniref:YccF domain-containing protein n=1 Tax=Halospeciosus flavus TaxID=3032283 RepID=A0ABD5Z785_9EURY|nr:YccF domain-containing protein [Halospeciosus flavus]
MSDRSLLTRAVWFLLVGWWATPLAIGFAWLLNVTVVGLPLGIKLINRVPWVLSLRERRIIDPDHGRDQYSLLLRAPYFVFVGWWASLLWGLGAAALADSIIGLPIAVWMLDRLPYVTTLYRY